MTEQNNEDIKKAFAESYGGDSLGGGVGLEGLRMNPSMYLSSASAEGARQALVEILQNSIDEALAMLHHLRSNNVKEIQKFKIQIKVYLDDTVEIMDTGRGVPVDINKKFNRPVLEIAFEENNVGGKGKNYVSAENSAYKARGIGKHGSGAACANATSDFFEVNTFVMKENKQYKARWENAVKVQPTVFVADANNIHGTHVKFRSSREVFELYSDLRGEVERYYDEDELKSILEEYAFTTENIEYTFEFEQPDGSWSTTVFDSDDFNRDERLSNFVDGEVYNGTIENEELKFSLDIYIGLNKDRPVTFISSNKLKMREGTHSQAINDTLDNLFAEILTYVNLYYEDSKIDRTITASDIIKLNIQTPSFFVSKDVSIEMDFPEYTGQTKQELKVPRIKPKIEETFRKMLDNELLEFKNAFILKMATLYLQRLQEHDALIADKKNKEERARRDKERKELLGKTDKKKAVRGMGSDEQEMIYARTASTKDVILYLVEGNTGANLMSKVRNVENESILPIIWSVPVVYTKTEKELFAMSQFKKLYKALAGDGHGKGNYKAVVIATDPDAYGKYIRAKLVALISEHFPGYLDKGKLYFFNVPKYVGYNSMDKAKEKPLYFDSQEKFRKHRDAEGNQGKFHYSNYKGLGSLSQELLRKLLADPNSLLKINPATWRIGIESLKMYLTDTELKKKYILEMYGDESVKDHVRDRKEILALQEIDFDVNSIDTDFVTAPNLAEARTMTNRETVMMEIAKNETNTKLYEENIFDVFEANPMNLDELSIDQDIDLDLD